jgi:hypothetical protein
MPTTRTPYTEIPACTCADCHAGSIDHHLLRLHGLAPTDTRAVLVYDQRHQLITRDTVTAAECFDAFRGYWSLFRLVDLPRLARHGGAFLTYAEE